MHVGAIGLCKLIFQAVILRIYIYIIYNPDYSKKTPPEIQTKLKGSWVRLLFEIELLCFLTLTLHILDIWTTASGL